MRGVRSQRLGTLDGTAEILGQRSRSQEPCAGIVNQIIVNVAEQFVFLSTRPYEVVALLPHGGTPDILCREIFERLCVGQSFPGATWFEANPECSVPETKR